MWMVKKVKKGFKSAYDVKKIMGLELLQNDAESIKNTWKDLTNMSNEARVENETFSQAMDRLDISEENLTKRADKLLLMSKIYGVTALFTLLYSIVLCFLGHVLSALLGFSLAFAVLTFLFRESFRLMEIRKRSLSCTFKDWLVFIKKSKSNRKGKQS